jgi:hypothetical protein
MCTVHATCRTDNNDQFYGMRVCIGGSPMDWFDPTPAASTGGVAWEDAFGRINPTNAGLADVQRDVFVFSE